MTNHEEVPFKVGQCVESRSFIPGYRGAWFRSKIMDIKRGQMKGIKKQHGSIKCYLEYLDFPDEKLTWVELYDSPRPNSTKQSKMKKQMMLRPSFPPVYRKSEISNVDSLLEVSVVIDDEWLVGDLVDWWTDSSYWSGSVTKVLGDGKLQIELLPPPLGEGNCYEVLSKDLRPTLDWSPEEGWTIPTPMVNPNRVCAQLFKPTKEGGVLENVAAVGGRMENATTGGCLSASTSSDGSLAMSPRNEGSSEQPHVTSVFARVNAPDGAMDSDHRCIGEASCSGCASSCITSKNLKTESNILLNVMFSNTAEAAILDLEELASRVKWLKRTLELGVPLSKRSKSKWKFAEHRDGTLT